MGDEQRDFETRMEGVIIGIAFSFIMYWIF